MGDRIRFANGYVDDVASLLAATHPRASEYLEQAPVVAVMTCQKMPANITFGELDRFRDLVASGPRLKDFIAAYGATAPMRRISASAVKLSDNVIISHLSRLDNSTLAQSIPSDSQRVWLDGIREWCRLMPTGKRAQAAFNVSWIARRLAENLSRYEQVGALVDYLGRGGGQLNERWSWDRAMAQVEDWHRTMRSEADLARLVADRNRAAAFDRVICKSGLPDRVEADGFSFTVLRTMRNLRDEGVAMHHCVASYAGAVKSGNCAIVSVARDGVKIATLEISKAGTVQQLKAHCNGAVPSSVRAACETYALLHWRAPEAAA